jgi:pyruvate dehydrogenase E2 component (dihydrolipoamide acetyltransferase)
VAVEIVMPRLSDAMEEGVILHWLVADGVEVQVGTPLLEVETDKATVTYDSEHTGTILALNADAGSTVAVGATIAIVGDPGDQDRGADATAGRQTPAALQPVQATTVAGGPAATSTSSGPPTTSTSSGPATTSTSSRGARVNASPLARRRAAAAGVDLEALAGSGPGGRVIATDVEAAAARGAVAQPATGEHEYERLTNLQMTIARRMSESRATVPDFELRRDVDMSRAVVLQDELRATVDPAPSFNDLVVRAAALALREFPRVNGSYRDETFDHHARVNIGIAVAADNSLVVPTIFDADRKSLSEIAADARSLAARVRERSISPDELTGGTFTVSNLGMHGIDSFSAVINPPQAAILAVGAVKPRPIVDQHGMVVARPTLQLTLACDHRILYGADGARFLARVCELLEKPLALLV